MKPKEPKLKEYLNTVGKDDGTLPIPRHLFYGNAELLARYGEFDFVVVIGMKEGAGIQAACAAPSAVDNETIVKALRAFIDNFEKNAAPNSKP